MYTSVLGVTISALILVSGVGGAIAQDRTMMPQPEQTQPHPMGQEGAGMMGRGMGGGMGHGMMDHGMMGHHMMEGMTGHETAGPPPVIFRVMFALIDTDSDGTISLPEFRRRGLLQGLDELSITLQDIQQVEGFLARARKTRPWAYPAVALRSTQGASSRDEVP